MKPYKPLVIVVLLVFFLLSISNRNNVVIASQSQTEAINLQQDTDEATDNEIIVRFTPDSTQAERDAYITARGGEIIRRIDALNAVVLRVNPVQANVRVDSSAVQSTEMNYQVVALQQVNDPLYAEQWNVNVVNAAQAWSELPSGVQAMHIAVIDSGICAEHPDLAGRLLPGYDFVENDAISQDVFGHGCAVSGIIAANINNGVGIAGIAPHTQIMPLRVLDGAGIGQYADVASAIVYAVDNGANVINLSLGGIYPSAILHDAVNYAVDRNVSLVGAAGNTGGDVLYPAAYPEVIAVGAVNSNLQVSRFSTTGPEVDVLAPGEEVLSLSPEGGYALQSGTSFAAAHVSAVLALEMAMGRSIATDGGIVVFGSPNQPPEETPIEIVNVNVSPEVEQAIQSSDTVDVIVSLNIVTAQGASGFAVEAAVATAQNAVLSSLFTDDFTLYRQYQRTPALALTINQAALNTLMNSPIVSHIGLDGEMTGFLDQVRAVLGVDEVHTDYGVTGEGVTVAVLDTGISANHPDLLDDIVAQQCFTNNKCVADIEGEPDSTTSNNANDEHGHGSHVSGIVTNSGVVSEVGIAPDAGIVAVRVLDESNNGRFADLIAGLDWVYANNDTLGVDVINMSLGGGVYAGVCDNLLPGLTSVLNDLRSSGVMIFAASGNDGRSDGMSVPACISSVLSVGATYDSDLGENSWGSAGCTDEITSVDLVACGSNGNAELDFLAPGSLITSSWVDGGSATIQGTSMASPAAAAVAALLLEADPDLSVAQIEMVMKETGVNVLDQRNGLTFPRVDALQAVSSLALNDSILHATEFSVLDSLYTTTQSTIYATVNVEEPIVSCGTDIGATVWYKYAAPVDGVLQINTMGSDFDTVVSVWSGEPSDLAPVGCNDDLIQGDLHSTLEVNVTAGNIYFISIGGNNQTAGQLSLFARHYFVGSPEVTSTLPADGAFEVGTQSPITIQFDRSVQITSNPAVISCGTETAIILDELELSERWNVKQLTLDPTTALPINTLCQVTLYTDAVTNFYDSSPLEGNGDDPSTYQFSFRPTLSQKQQFIQNEYGTLFGGGPFPASLSETLFIDAEGTVTDVTLQVAITHPYVGELDVWITSPAGTEIVVFDNQGDSGDNIDATFSDAATQTLDSGAAPFVGTFKPAQPFSLFNGESSFGDWTITINDNASSINSGALNTLALTIAYVIDETQPLWLDASASAEQGITLTFNEPVDITSEAITLSCSGTSIPLGGLPASQAVFITLTYERDLPADTTCEVTIDPGVITDQAGNLLNEEQQSVLTFDSSQSTPTFTPTLTFTPTATHTPTFTSSPTHTPSPTFTSIPTFTPTATATHTPMFTVTPAHTLIPTTETVPIVPTEESLPPGGTDVVIINNGTIILPELVWMPTAEDNNQPEVAEWYNIVIQNERGEVVLNIWVEGSEICDLDGCTFTPDEDDLPAGLQGGAYTWWIGPWSDGEYDTWIETSLVIPDTPQPSGVVVDFSTGQPVVSMDDDPNTRWVNLYIGTSDLSRTLFYSWVEATDANCDGMRCTFAPDIYPRNGDYVIYLQTWGPAGFNGGSPNNWMGPYAAILDWPVVDLVSDMQTSLGDNGRISFSWQVPEGALWYQIWVGKLNPTETAHLQWYSVNDLACESGRCAVTPGVSFTQDQEYVWYVLAWGPGGITTEGVQGWAAGDAFTP